MGGNACTVIFLLLKKLVREIMKHWTSSKNYSTGSTSPLCSNMFYGFLFSVE